MKQVPATSRPRQPARTLPMWIASSVELGPGIRFEAPIRSRNSCSSTCAAERSRSASWRCEPRVPRRPRSPAWRTARQGRAACPRLRLGCSGPSPSATSWCEGGQEERLKHEAWYSGPELFAGQRHSSLPPSLTHHLAASIPYRNRCLGEDRALLALFTLLRGREILRSSHAR